MPELPEVETVKNGLQKLIVNKKITDLSFDFAKSYPNSTTDTNQFVLGAKILKVKRRAKLIIIYLSSNYNLVIHLKMTGQLVFRGQQNFGGGHPTDSLVAKLPDKSTRVVITFSDKNKLFFNDQRKFGWIKLTPTNLLNSSPLMIKLGPEPLSSKFNSILLKERLLRRKNSPIKAALLDQSVIVGIGNIYADESLWLAKIHPATKVLNLKDEEIELLATSIVKLLNLAIKKGGSTDRNYVNAEGINGSYLSLANVFRRDGQTCPRCYHEIIKLRVASRGTHICPRCQKLKAMN